MVKKTEQEALELPGEEIDKVFTVAEFIEVLNVFFKKERVRLVGEISEFKRAPSGHVYFSIKDKEAPGTLSCIIWGRNYDLCGVVLEVGMEIVLSGYPNIYPNSGKLSFVADTVELVGEGALKKAYEALKRKLEEEGIFALERKRQIPEFVHKIGVITSREGAVIHDFVNNLGKFGFEVNLVDARVEGQQAVKSLLDAIRTLAKRDIEVLVIIRGGGSLESLQAFNNETLIREIVGFKVPVIAGIGHDQDVPLLALAADYMTSTPTAAAHLVSRSWEEAVGKLDNFITLFDRTRLLLARAVTDLAKQQEYIIKRVEESLRVTKELLVLAELAIIRSRVPLEVERISNALQSSWQGICYRFEGAVKDTGQTLALVERASIRSKIPIEISRLRLMAANYWKSIGYRLETGIKNTNQFLGKAEDAARYNDPLRQLQLGYAISRSGGKIIRDTRLLKAGEIVEVQLAKGGFQSEVKIINP